MKEVHSDAELQQLHTIGKGLIYNDYSGDGTWGFQYNVLHDASCRHIRKANVKYPKLFFDTLPEAIAWLSSNRGQESVNWKRCGTCHAQG